MPRPPAAAGAGDSTGLRDNAGALDTLRALRDAGFPVTVGDFALNDSVIDLRGGTPCDQVVLPRQLFASAREEPLLEGLMQVVEALGLSALARGVETEAEAERLRRRAAPLRRGALFRCRSPRRRRGSSSAGGGANGKGRPAASSSAPASAAIYLDDGEGEARCRTGS